MALETPLRVRPIVTYPESDGEPMAETDIHRKQMTYLIQALEVFFHGSPEIYVAGNLFLYWEEGDPTKVVAPDVFVVKGVPKRDRRTYKLWEEGKPPILVFEITSARTRFEDIGPKKGLYEALGAQEYFLFDPLEEYLRPPLVGYRLREAQYTRVEPEVTPDGAWRLRSEVLNLDLKVEGERLWLVEPTTGRKLPEYAEAVAAHHEAEARAGQETQARQQIEARVAQVEAELERLKGELRRIERK
ncbi:MAG: Uma2 family endonuclease [Chloroflexi bacterium]|nr:Uma2 family endonuclease [Chloroflexota bacterium]